ncbi:hypothetical protein P4597_27665 [Peribacillus simplex]|uniref:hypothetical protein n=1 Tax=Peribacillus simplex TaxID=1478 RepID=UPI002E1B47B9|nr:hypothetical protein [Peribacillus simplex]
MVNKVFEGEIGTLNKLPYYIDKDNNSWIEENDIIDYLCDSNGSFYMKYFIDKTYLNRQNKDGKFPLLHVLIAAHEVFEKVADTKSKTYSETEYEKLVYPFIFQLAKIGANNLGGNKTPLHIMEEMLLKKI